MIENLALSGGGIKTLAFCGALHALEKAGILKGIKRIIGTSAGSMVGLFLACGFTSDEMVNMIRERDLIKLKGDSTWLENLHRFVFNYGFYSSHVFEEWTREYFGKKGINSDITFQEIYDKFGIELTMVGTNLNLREIVYFNRHEYPNMSAINAFIISMSIPLYFEPVQLDGNIYVDGGLFGNYPLPYFKSVDPLLEKSIGLNVFSADELLSESKIVDVFQVIVNIIRIMTSKSDLLSMDDIVKSRTIVINTKDVEVTDFHINNEMKEKLFGRGYRCVKNALKVIKYD